MVPAALTCPVPMVPVMDRWVVLPAGGVPPEVSVECSLFGSVPVLAVAASWK